MSLDQVKSHLEPWLGGRARVLDYSSSHSVLRVHVSVPTAENPDRCVVALFGGCRLVQFRSAWGSFSPSFSRAESSEGETLVVSDGSHFHVSCEAVRISAIYDRDSDIPASWLSERYLVSATG